LLILNESVLSYLDIFSKQQFLCLVAQKIFKNAIKDDKRLLVSVFRMGNCLQILSDWYTIN